MEAVFRPKRGGSLTDPPGGRERERLGHRSWDTVFPLGGDFVSVGFRSQKDGVWVWLLSCLDL